MKIIFCVLILAAVYFFAVGFLRTAGKFGWTETANVHTTTR